MFYFGSANIQRRVGAQSQFCMCKCKRFEILLCCQIDLRINSGTLFDLRCLRIELAKILEFGYFELEVAHVVGDN